MTQRTRTTEPVLPPTPSDERAGAVLTTLSDEARYTELARVWVAEVAKSNFLPEGRSRGRALLEGILRRLVAALSAEPFEASEGYLIGATLVANDITSPRALGDSISLLSGRMLEDLGIGDDYCPARLAALLGQLATGFTEAMRDRALLASENLNRHERSVWRDRQDALHRRLQHALLHDQLTGLPNRASLTRWLDDAITGASPDERLGLCILTLDRFKSVIDSLGTERADQLLLAVAQRLRSQAARHGHFLAHLGGDTFAVAVSATTSADDLVKVADRALRALSDPIRLDGHQIPVSAAVGIVERPVAGARTSELIRAADISVGWARTDAGPRAGGGRWAVFNEERNAAEVLRHRLTADMPTALARREFTLAYQPLVRLSDDELVGVEALARWNHGTYGPVSPMRFIPAAEDTGLIVQLGLVLLEQACEQTVAWRRETGRTLSVSVNLAVAQLREPGLLADVFGVLRRTGLGPEDLQLEITESALIDSGDDAVDTLHAMVQEGIRLAIDDFGTGYSSLAYLAELPVHNLKLAARFQRGIDTSAPSSAATGRSNRMILPALVSLAHELGLTVTAEGIETAAQAEHLRGIGCDFGQGYVLGRPMVSSAITDLLA